MTKRLKKKMTEGSRNIFLDKMPPHDPDAEASIICSILLNSDVLEEIADIISPEDFYTGAHRLIFSAMIDLFESRGPIDAITLSDRLGEKGSLKKIGGAAFLAKLMDTVPVAVNAKQYAGIVHKKASLRRLISAGSRIIERCFRDEGSVDGVFDLAEQSIFDVTERKIRSSYVPIKEILLPNVKTLEKRYANRGVPSGVPTGFTKLDILTSGLQPSDLIILAARPSMGKTALALNIARNAAVESNVAVAVFSLEMSKEQLSMRVLCSESRVNASRLQDGFLTGEDFTSITDAADILEKTPIFFDDSPDMKALDIRVKARRLKMKENLGLVIIDYLQLMEASRKNDRRDLEISEISRALKNLAKELNIPVIALSQLNRALEKRNDKHPQLSDLRESGSLEQDADLVLFIYRDEVYNKGMDNPNRGLAEIMLAKNRNGPTGKVDLAFLASYTRFENLAK